MTHTTTFRQKDNGWQIIVSWKDTDGKWHQKSRQGFAKKSDAKAAESDLIQSIKKEPRPVEKSMAGITLEAFCESYLKIKKSVSAGTKRNYTNAVKALSSLAKRPIHTITYLKLQTAISEWKYKPVTQKNYKAKLNILFRAAVKPYGLIATNPMVDIETPKDRERKTIHTVPDEKFSEIIKALAGQPPVRTAIIIGYYTGMRRSEICALKWSDIDFAGESITVNRQIAFISHTRRGIESTTKSKNGFRTIPIPPELVKALCQYRKAVPIQLDGQLFRRPLYMYERIGTALKVFGVRPHELRHTYATNLLAHGMDVQTVAALMGDNVQTVINTYIHYTDEMRKAAAKSIKKIFAQNF